MNSPDATGRARPSQSDRIEADIKANGPAIYTQISDRLDVSPTGVASALTVLRRAGVIRYVRNADGHIMRIGRAALMEWAPPNERSKPLSFLARA